MGSKILRFARCVQSFVLFVHSKSSCQRKNNKYVSLWTVNSKNSKKIKKIWIFLASKRRESASCVQIFVVFGHWRGLWRKKQNLAREKTWEKMTILFFLARAPRMSFDHKNLQAPCAPKPLWCQKISYFFEFSCYFISNLLFTSVQINCFSSPRAPGMSK